MTGRGSVRAGLAAATVVALAACGPSPDAAEETAPAAGDTSVEESRACVPPAEDASPDPGATLAEGAGSWMLAVVAQEGPAAGTRVDASLTLRQHDLAMQALEGMDGSPLPNASAPLWGFTDLDLESLGAIPTAGLDSEDPAAPGVGLYETRSGDGSAAPSLILRLGSAANRRSGTAMDGASTALRVLEIEENEVRGRWRSSVNAQTRASGYFCAFRPLEGYGD